MDRLNDIFENSIILEDLKDQELEINQHYWKFLLIQEVEIRGKNQQKAVSIQW